jgi:SRSO17 transposase
VTIGREAEETVKFVDEYSEPYRDLFEDVRSFESFKLLHIGLLSELPRKSLPAIATAVGDTDSQSLHHLVADGSWQVEALRERRLALTRQAVSGRAITLVLDETGDRKKGHTTDYVARQYLGNVGKVDNGLVSVNAYGVLAGVTFPLLFEVYKPQSRLKAGDVYRTKPQLAAQLLRQVRAAGFTIDLVLADSLYGESDNFLQALGDLPFVLALHDDHAVWLPEGEHIQYTPWQPFLRTFSDGTQQQRYLSEVIYGQRGAVRYFQLTTDPVTLPKAATCLVMTNLPGDVHRTLGDHYGLRTWIEYGFKHIKNELGWADFRFTDYVAIARWWELVCCAYLLVSLHCPTLQAAYPVVPSLAHAPTSAHPRWKATTGWKQTLNNLRLLLHPFLALCLILPWLTVFTIPHLEFGLTHLISCINLCT